MYANIKVQEVDSNPKVLVRREWRQKTRCRLKCGRWDDSGGKWAGKSGQLRYQRQVGLYRNLRDNIILRQSWHHERLRLRAVEPRQSVIMLIRFHGTNHNFISRIGIPGSCHK